MSKRPAARPAIITGIETLEGEISMVIDNMAVIALGFLGSILVVTGGLAYFVLSRLKP